MSLFSSALIEKSTVKSKYTHKLKVQVLHDVYQAFITHREPSWFDNNLALEYHDVIFEYDGKEWCGSIERRSSNHNDRIVCFTNIKLPNDGYFYCDEYCDDDLTDGDNSDLVKNEELSLLIKSVVDSFGMSKEEEGELFVCNKKIENRLEIFQWNHDRSKGIAVMFEYGTYHSIKNKKIFDRRAISCNSSTSK